MRIISEVTLVEALTKWGMHEVSGRQSSETSCDPNDPQACLEYILWFRSPYIARILERGPIQTFLVEFEAADINNILLADGRPIKKWIEEVKSSGGKSLEYFSKLSLNSSLLNGRLLAASKIFGAEPLKLSTFVLYDGWHRVAAWSTLCENDPTCTIQSYLVLSSKEDVFFRKKQ